MTFERAFKISLALHAVLLFMMAGAPMGCGGKGNGDDKDNGNGNAKETKQHIVPKKDTMDVDLVNPPKEGIKKTNKRVKAKARDCGKGGWFGGVGLTEVGQTIYEVYPGYPAYRVGLMRGDVLLNSGTLKGPPGTKVTIDFIRSGKRFSVQTIRERICIEQGDGP